MLYIFTESDEACKRCDECADAADIYSDKQIRIVFREL